MKQQASEAVATLPPQPLLLTDVSVRTDKDNRGPWSIYAKVNEAGAGAVVGLSARVESCTLADGSIERVDSEWRLADSDELAYGKPSPEVTGFRIMLPRHPRQPYARVRLQLRAAVAGGIERVAIPDFQLNKELKVSGRNYTIAVSGREGLALGRDPATLIHCGWAGPPADIANAAKEQVFVGWLMGFIGQDGKLITPCGMGGGYMYLGREWAGMTLAFDVPVGVRVMEMTVDVDIPWKESPQPRNELSFSPAKARPDLDSNKGVIVYGPSATPGPRMLHEVDWKLSGPGTLIGLFATAVLPDDKDLPAMKAPSFNQHQVGQILLDLPDGEARPDKILLAYTAVVAEGTETFAFDNIRPDQKRSERKKQSIERPHFRPAKMPLGRVDLATSVVDGRLCVELAVCRYIDDVVLMESCASNWRVVLVDSAGKIHEPKPVDAPYTLSDGPDTYTYLAGRQMLEFTDGWQDGGARLEVTLPTKFNRFDGEADVTVE